MQRVLPRRKTGRLLVRRGLKVLKAGFSGSLNLIPAVRLRRIRKIRAELFKLNAKKRDYARLRDGAGQTLVAHHRDHALELVAKGSGSRKKLPTDVSVAQQFHAEAGIALANVDAGIREKRAQLRKLRRKGSIKSDE